MIIRAEQLGVLKKQTHRAFVDETINMLRQYTPRHFQVLEEAQIRDAVLQSWDHAASYGITSEQGVQLFVYLSFQLGSQFYADPQLNWVHRFQPESGNGEEWIRHVYDEAVQFLDRTAGSSGEILKEVLFRIRDGLNFERLAGIPASEAALADWLEVLYPSKAVLLGNGGVRQVAKAGIVKAEAYGLSWPRGTAVYTALQFLLGSAFEADPLASWAMTVLGSSAPAEEKAVLLEGTAREKLEMWLS